MHGCLFGLTRQTFSTFCALKILLIENAIKIHLYLFFVGSELVLDVSDPMPARTLFYHYQVGHCREPTRTLFVAGSELVRVRVDPEPFISHFAFIPTLQSVLTLFSNFCRLSIHLFFFSVLFLANFEYFHQFLATLTNTTPPTTTTTDVAAVVGLQECPRQSPASVKTELTASKTRFTPSIMKY